MSKGLRIFLISLAVLIAVTIVAFWIYICYIPKATVTYCDTPETISSTDFHPGNNRQDEASVWLGCYDGNIYYYGGHKPGLYRTKYDFSSLCVFRDGELTKVLKLTTGSSDSVTIFGIVDRYLYYRELAGDDFENQKLYCINLENNEKKVLYCGDLYNRTSLYFADDGSVYFPLYTKYKEEAKFVHVSGETVLGVEVLTEGYPLGDSIYFVVAEHGDAQTERILKVDMEGDAQKEVQLDSAYGRAVIPYENGLLVHNRDWTSLLYRIDEEGEVTELFNVEAMSTNSAVNIHKTDAYISVLRYEKHGEYGKLPYENDSISGTYRVDLTDGTTEKVSDMIFNGIYNFDDTCFYCCDGTGNLYKMDFDGTVEPVMLVS